jgi:hypothetical protein
VVTPLTVQVVRVVGIATFVAAEAPWMGVKNPIHKATRATTDEYVLV